MPARYVDRVIIRPTGLPRYGVYDAQLKRTVGDVYRTIGEAMQAAEDLNQRHWKRSAGL